MADYASVQQYAKTLAYTSQAAQSQINDFFSTLDLSQPEAARDALLKFVPAVVQKYGTVAGQLACERYEALRAEQMGEGYSAIPSDLPTEEEVSSIVRSQADQLWSDDPSKMLGITNAIADRLIVQQARNTTMANVDNENAGGRRMVRYARIPTGPMTCAWCIMLAGLGWPAVLPRQSLPQTLRETRRFSGEAPGPTDTLAARLAITASMRAA